ncbi:ricin B lectin domain-containing protein [Mycena rebaudengoi]|nr:ricin B lectin domain-containing protein [Mycena rebaudengoi]
MISSVLVAFSALALSASAKEIQSSNPFFFNAGIQGCISVAANGDGEPVFIHDCNTQKDLKNQDWETTWAVRGDTAPGPITIFGNKCLDVPNGANVDGTALQIWTCTGGPNQKFISTIDRKFKWAGSNKCIDLTGGRIADGTALQLFTCDDGNALNTNQHWTSSENPSELARQGIYAGNPNVQPPPLTGEPFCVGAASNADGAKVILLGCGVDNAGTDFSAANSTWMAPLAPLTGQFKTYDNKCLDVPNGENKNGVKLQIWTCAAGNTNQLFQMRRDRIEWKGSNKCLDLTDGNSTIGIQFQLWDCAASSSNANQDIRTFLSS